MAVSAQQSLLIPRDPELARAEDRFWAKARLLETGCLEWLGAKGQNGYGKFKYLRLGQYAHRFAYERFVGPIPDGLEIDHLCCNRACVNPAHLEVVTHAENKRRQKQRRAAA